MQPPGIVDAAATHRIGLLDVHRPAQVLGQALAELFDEGRAGHAPKMGFATWDFPNLRPAQAGIDILGN